MIYIIVFKLVVQKFSVINVWCNKRNIKKKTKVETEKEKLKNVIIDKIHEREKVKKDWSKKLIIKVEN